MPSSTNPSMNADQKEPLRLLVLDDEPAIVRFLKALLEEEGLQVFEFTDPGQALAEYRQVRPHLVILDWIMAPGFGGSEFLKKLRAFDREVPVVVISGYANDMTQEEKKCLEECRVSEVIPKNLNMDNARERILGIIAAHYPLHKP